ncbi:MAG: flagellar biosynthesis protein FlhA [Planctomycetales bacterium]|nr:flagellar biosynthesis protein FlhA [Planctomycetales bacterium]
MSIATAPPLTMNQRSELVFPLAVMAILVVLIVPLPTAVLDVLLTLSLSFTILLLLVTLGVGSPMELSVFPSALLLLTLTRLSLNVATTRLILTQADAGQLVEAFGNFVVGGNLVVGLVVFLILIIIQFVVITKGSTRISEIAARFFLDAMPGKQMSIDGDLNSHAISDAEAKRRREALLQEADFYGSMDGASKFVRGDAVAGLIITGINLVGGIIIGLMNGMPPVQALKVYSILTVGDGLISQIPALIIATAAGILVTKSSNQVGLGSQLGSQFFSKRQPLQIGAGLLGLLALAPGMPSLPFLFIAGALYYASRQLTPAAIAAAAEAQEIVKPVAVRSVMEQHLDEFLETDRACIEIGPHLVSLVDPKRDLGLLQRIASMRKDLAKRCGLWIPLVRIRDNAQLADQEYRILVAGQEAGRSTLRIGYVLAIHPGGARIPLKGDDIQDPAFGLPAKWISENDRSQATMLGCTVIDAPNVIVTHLREVLKRHSGDLLSREDLSALIEKAREKAAAVIDELIPNMISMGTLHRILSLLLDERIPITNLTVILEGVSHNAQSCKDPADFAERVRPYLARAICDPFIDADKRLHALVLEPSLEQDLKRSVQDKKLAVSPDIHEALMLKIGIALEAASQKGVNVALLVDSQFRRTFRQFIQRAFPDLSVIAFTEVPLGVTLEADAVIKRNEVYAPHMPVTGGSPT